MKLQDLLDYNKLASHLETGLVSCRNHPDYENRPWRVLNYAPEVQFEKRWDDVTLLTRGLVFDGLTNEVLARPFPKFFNLAELTRPPEGAYRVFDKLDGALGIGIYPGQIATRGSFESPHAAAAMQIWAEKYSTVEWPTGWTPLWEIIHPVSRVVVEYGFEDLCLLCMINIETGQCFYPKDHPYCDWWPGPIAREFTDIDYNNPPVRSNAEGFVVVFEDGTRVKIKYDEYVQLHKIVTGLNENTVLEWCMSGEYFGDKLAQLPDELYKWADNLSKDYFNRFYAIVVTVKDLFDSRPSFDTRRDFAFWVGQFPAYASMLFGLLDNKSIDLNVWKLIKQEIKNESKDSPK